MVLVIEKKFLEGVWWKYGLALAAAKIGMWVALGYHWEPGMDLLGLFRQGVPVWTMFAFCAFLPFALGRLQLRRLFWFALVGFFVAETAYLFLALARFGSVLPLLPLIAFLQLYVTFFSLGVVWELGRYAYLKLTE
jgi:hypothetical protein